MNALALLAPAALIPLAVINVNVDKEQLDMGLSLIHVSTSTNAPQQMPLQRINVEPMLLARISSQLIQICLTLVTHLNLVTAIVSIPIAIQLIAMAKTTFLLVKFFNDLRARQSASIWMNAHSIPTSVIALSDRALILTEITIVAAQTAMSKSTSTPRTPMLE